MPEMTGPGELELSPDHVTALNRIITAQPHELRQLIEDLPISSDFLAFSIVHYVVSADYQSDVRRILDTVGVTPREVIVAAKHLDTKRTGAPVVDKVRHALEEAFGVSLAKAVGLHARAPARRDRQASTGGDNLEDQPRRAQGTAAVGARELGTWSKIERIIREASHEHRVTPVRFDEELVTCRYVNARQLFEMAEEIDDEARIRPYCDAMAGLVIALVRHFGQHPSFLTAVCDRIIHELVSGAAECRKADEAESEAGRELVELAVREQRATLVDKLMDRMAKILALCHATVLVRGKLVR